MENHEISCMSSSSHEADRSTDQHHGEEPSPLDLLRAADADPVRAPGTPATPPRPTSQSSPIVPPVPSTWLVPQTTERDSSGAPEPSSCRRPHLMYAHGSGPTRCGAMRSLKREAPFARMPPADSLEPNARWQAKLQITPANDPCARSLLRSRPWSWSRSCAKRS